MLRIVMDHLWYRQNLYKLDTKYGWWDGWWWRHLLEFQDLQESEEVECNEKGGGDDPVDGEVGAEQVQLDVHRVQSQWGGLKNFLIQSIFNHVNNEFMNRE